jgi:hypothetical protein
MKQRIPLTAYNKQVLTTLHGIKPEELTQQYWIQKIMSDPNILLPLLNDPRMKKDAQRRVLGKANKMMYKNIYSTLGLPGKSGSAAKQRKWHKIVKQAGLTTTIS